ncbi:MAG: hypothetical protein KGI88_05715 [Betaproteobacteria bacterium]|nr:hypothetical protein [Betaproteobacteria bacterium]MDE2056710.1 hypothetical protein [Betaproteobacteria bacterium]
MNTVSHRLLTALVLTIMVVLTQSHHFMTLYHFPPAAFAVMYLGGFFLKRLSWFVYLSCVVAFIDSLTISLGAAAGAYFSWSYLFMFPAYALLWFAGLWANQQSNHGVMKSGVMTLISFFSIALAEMIASGSFYLLKTPNPHSVSGLIQYYTTWAYQSVESFLFWALPIMAIYYVVKVAAVLIKGGSHQDLMQR